MSFRKLLNRSGPRINPCGTPYFISLQELYSEFILVLCDDWKDNPE